MFWPAAGALLALALAFVLWPVVSGRAAGSRARASRRDELRALYRDRVAELDREAAAGQLDPGTRAQVVDELGANLLDELEPRSPGVESPGAESPGVESPGVGADSSPRSGDRSHPGETSSSPRSGDRSHPGAANSRSRSGDRSHPGETDSRSRSGDRSRTGTPTPRRLTPAFWLLLLLVPAGAVGIYLGLGEPDAAQLAGASQVLQLDPHTHRAELERWRGLLARRVEERPEDGQSWYLLGVSRLQLSDFAGAAEAFAAAHRFVGADPSIALYWLQARYLAAGGRLDQQSQALAQQVLQVRPNHPVVLEMFAIDAYRRGDYRSAVEHLNRALQGSLPPQQEQALLAGLEEARSRMGTLKPTIDVEVSAPEAAPRRGSLFVIARPPGGGMPYAVVRRPADRLPLSVRLDDTTTMSGLKLSDAGEIQVVVRLSPSGKPTGGPGDWEWQSGVLRTADLDDPLTLSAPLAPADATES